MQQYGTAPLDFSNPNEVESLARELHDVYQEHAHRVDDVRHPDSYDDLAENIKEYDRVIARHVLMFTDPPRESTSRGGRHVEFGIALHAGKALVLIGEPENVFQWLPQVHRFKSFDEILERLQ